MLSVIPCGGAACLLLTMDNLSLNSDVASVSDEILLTIFPEASSNMGMHPGGSALDIFLVAILPVTAHVHHVEARLLAVGLVVGASQQLGSEAAGNDLEGWNGGREDSDVGFDNRPVHSTRDDPRLVRVRQHGRDVGYADD